MKDMIDNIYETLNANTRFHELIGNRIRKYDYPESAEKVPIFCLILPLAPPVAKTGASDTGQTVQFYFQVNIEGLVRLDVKEASHIVADVMRGFNFAQLDTGLDEYFPDTGRFVDARRYRGFTKLYDTDY